jgi:AcrR family transcriptional regulator
VTEAKARKRGRKEEQSRETQERLIRVATELFAEKGYAATATEDLVARAGMTRGALYHQYADKRDLFRAVFESVEQQLGLRMAQSAAAATDPAEQFRLGTRAFLEAALEPAVRRIVLLEGPTVLGREEWRRIDSQYAFSLVRAVWEANIAAGNVPPLPLDALTEVMLGALNAAGLAVAAAGDPKSAIAEFTTIIDAVQRGFWLAAHSRSPSTRRRSSAGASTPRTRAVEKRRSTRTAPPSSRRKC